MSGTYFLNLFSPETWEAFRANGATVSGFSRKQETRANSIQPGDTLLCYVTGLSRWCGVLRVRSRPYLDERPIFKVESDPFVVRFDVEPIVVLDLEDAIPVTEKEVWQTLSITREIEPGSVGWGANFQGSLRSLPTDDAKFLETLLSAQLKNPKKYELSEKDRKKLAHSSVVRTERGEISVAIPEDDADGDAPESHRESHTIQAMLAEIGARMGFGIWLPRNDRERVLAAASDDFRSVIVETLPMNYNDATIRTIEQIDLLWLRGRSIARAFEVEHTTAIYSGLLRMADLVALQPDIHIPLHIVAPEERRDNVINQINRPVFSLFETGPLASRCTYLSYGAVKEIRSLPHLAHLNSSILDEYVDEASI
ncbi:MAG: hypothetical protein RLO80_06650 [Hyphomonas sp.]